MTRRGFTLAEVLITLVVIGVIAAITVPVVSSNVQKKVKEERVSNIRHKFSKATDAMLSSVGMNGYSSTMEFVQEFAKHFKIAKICDNNHIADCWPTRTVTTVGATKSSEWEIEQTKTARTLLMPNNFNVDWDDTVGIITNDGTGMILSYNKKCDKSATDGIVWGGDNSSSNTCVAAVFDWNGGKKPNTFGTSVKNADIYSINAGGLGLVCAIEVNGTCFTPAFKPTALSNSSREYLDKLGIKYKMLDNIWGSNDLWGGAVEACGGINNMPSRSELVSFQSQMYTRNADNTLTLNVEFAQSMGIKLSNNGAFLIWDNVEADNQMSAKYQVFYPTHGDYGQYYRSYTSPHAICKI